MVRPEVFPGIAKLVIVLKALASLTVAVEFAGITKFAVMTLPSTLVPVMATFSGDPVLLEVGETLRARGKSG